MGCDVDARLGKERRKFEIRKGRKTVVNANDVYCALSKNDDPEKSFSDKDVFIRDRFDRVFFLVSQLESARRSDLVRLDDIKFPLNWYVRERFCPRKALFDEYMKQYSAPEAIHFIHSLPEWNNCRS